MNEGARQPQEQRSWWRRPGIGPFVRGSAVCAALANLPAVIPWLGWENGPSVGEAVLPLALWHERSMLVGTQRSSWAKEAPGLKGMSVDLSWLEWALLRLAVLLITTPAVVAAVYLIFRKRGP